MSTLLIVLLFNHMQAEKKTLNSAKARDEALLKKSSLDINLVEEDEEDKRFAHLLTKYRTVSCKPTTPLLLTSFLLSHCN